MRKTTLNWGLPIIALAGLIILFFKYQPPSPVAAPFTVTQIPAGVGVPIRIKIPGANVDAAVEQVAITKDGFMDVPRLPLDTAWLKLGPRPGEKGSAVIDGHVDWKYGAKAVFSNLHNLIPGDIILVEDSYGKIISFVVRASKTLDQNAEAKEVFSSNDGKAHLNLITCSGVWDKITQGYSQRLVVFADEKIQ